MDGARSNMVHYHCLVCEMRATCVETASSGLAWLDHMESHPQSTRRRYRAWKWSVEVLFDPDEL